MTPEQGKRIELMLGLSIAGLLVLWGIGIIPGKAAALFIALVVMAIVVGRA